MDGEEMVIGTMELMVGTDMIVPPILMEDIMDPEKVEVRYPL